MIAFEWGDRLPTLLASRVALRHIEPSDAADLISVFSDQDAMGQWVSMQSLADVDLFLQVNTLGLERRQLFCWGIADRTDNRIVGTCGLSSIDPRHYRGEVGFMLMPSRWGQGLAREAVTAVLAFAFNTLDLHRVEAFTLPSNSRAVALLKRMGFQQEGHLRQRYHVGGTHVDALAFGLLRSEWNQRTR